METSDIEKQSDNSFIIINKSAPNFSPKLIDVVMALLYRNRVDEAIMHLIDWASFFYDRQDFLDMTLDEMQMEIERRKNRVLQSQLSDKFNFWLGEEGVRRKL